MLTAGIGIYGFIGGLLHTKSVVSGSSSAARKLRLIGADKRRCEGVEKCRRKQRK
jgi:hypothetical protein